ncbi:MAG TPA: HAMP domain-containing sensor histidine kinase, partial [Polyangia bacterium]|nr:HAMP domain-containing sensor histidine kinase [Polyangia bacterium]
LEGDEPVRLTVTPADPAKAAVCERLATLRLDRRHLPSWSAIETKRPQLLGVITSEQLEAMAQNTEHLALLRELAPRSAIIAPMFSGSGLFGALVVASTTAGRFGERDLDFVTELARRAALAIENARLFEAEQRATRARDEVLAIVVHDVRNPLSSISFAASALKHQQATHGSAPDARSVELIFRSVSRANHLIQDLLDTTRIDAGAFSVDCGALGSGQVLLDAVEAERALASSASLELRLEAERDLPPIWADRARMLQVFENLVGNALKFTPKGGRITIGAIPQAGEVLFSVADTGAGISAENLPHVFDRFWRAERATRQGAGLGLPICKGIVEAHGGRIWVESVPGRGTTFSFTIPIAPSLAERPGDAASL